MKQRRFSKGVYIVIAAAVLLSLFYDSFQPRNIESVTVVSGVGMEKGDEKRLKLTIQMIKPQKGDTGTSTSSSMVITGEGNTVTEAVEDIMIKTGSVLFWAHCSVVLVHEKFAEEEDLVPHLDMFFRSANFRNTASLIITDKTPKEVFDSTTIFEMVSAFGIQKLLDDQVSESNSVYMSLKKFIKNYYMPSKSAVIAGVTTIKTDETSEGSKGDSSEKEKNKDTISLGECAVIKNGKFITRINDEELNGYKWLSGTMESKLITAENVRLYSDGGQKNTLGISLFGAGCRLRPMYEDGSFVLNVNINVKAQIISIENELRGENVSYNEIKHRYEDYERIIRENIEADINAAINKAKETESDFCNLGDIFYQRLGRIWLENAGETTAEILDGITIRCNINVNVISGNLNKRYSS